METSKTPFISLPVLDTLLMSSFFISGLSALMYQVSWQRSLFGIVGADIDSVTIVVSVFMLGIGVGGMVGGYLADLLPKKRIQIYAFIELSIAAFGFASLLLLQTLDTWLLKIGGDTFSSTLGSMLFLATPTLFMGMTLPLLTLAFNEWQDSIGVSVGQLYFINTLGAAIGAGLVPFMLLPIMPLDAVVRLAACGNVLVSALALTAFIWQNHNVKKDLRHV